MSDPATLMQEFLRQQQERDDRKDKEQRERDEKLRDEQRVALDAQKAEYEQKLVQLQTDMQNDIAKKDKEIKDLVDDKEKRQVNMNQNFRDALATKSLTATPPKTSKYKNLKKLDCKYDDPNVLRELILWQNGLEDFMDEERTRLLDKKLAKIIADSNGAIACDPEDFETTAINELKNERDRIDCAFGGIFDFDSDKYGTMKTSGTAGPPASTETQLMKQVNSWLYDALKASVTDSSVSTTVSDSKYKPWAGFDAYYRVVYRVDPQTVATAVRKIMILLDARQDAATLSEHI